MLNMLNMLESGFWKMRFFLRKCWICWICWIILGTTGHRNRHKGSSAENDSTYSTYSTFQQKEAHFLESTYQHIQHIQHFSRKKHFLFEMGLFLQEKFNIGKKNALSAEKIKHRQKKRSFCRNNSTCPQKSAPTGEMLNSRVFFGLREGDWLVPKTIQHIQHIQHFSRKKRFFLESTYQHIQHIQHFSRKKHFLFEKRLFLQK